MKCKLYIETNTANWTAMYILFPLNMAMKNAEIGKHARRMKLVVYCF